MSALRIEHVNVAVGDPRRVSAMLEGVFGWHVRWSGSGLNGLPVVHVGAGDHYLALSTAEGGPFGKGRPLHHVGIEVDDLGAAEARVAAAGLTPFSHGDYEPGRRFYFLSGEDGIEFEVVSYEGAAR